MSKKKAAVAKVVKKAKEIFDGWGNVATGLGMLRTDKRKHSKFDGQPAIDRITVTALYRNDGFSRRIVDLPVNEMTRKWIEIEGDEDGVLLDELERIKVKSALKQLLTWSKVYGGAVMFLGIDDSQEADMPLNIKSIRNIKFLRVYDRYQVQWMQSDISTDMTSEWFGLPEFYKITPLLNATQSFRVHRSRLIIMNGLDVPDVNKAVMLGWGDSVYQPVFEKLRALNAVYDSVEFVLNDFIQTVISIQGLMDMISSGHEDEALKRVHIMDMTKHIANTVLLDAEGETYQKHSSTVTGLPDVIDRFVQSVSAVTGIPVTLLMGQAPAGLSATGDNDVRNWYDRVASEQSILLNDPLNYLISILLASKERTIKGFNTKKLPLIKYVPLWQMTEKETADIHKVQAEADAVYINLSVLTQSEVAESRFGGDHYSLETTLDAETRREPTPPDEE